MHIGSSLTYIYCCCCCCNCNIFAWFKNQHNNGLIRWAWETYSSWIFWNSMRRIVITCQFIFDFFYKAKNPQNISQLKIKTYWEEVDLIWFGLPYILRYIYLGLGLTSHNSCWHISLLPPPTPGAYEKVKHFKVLTSLETSSFRVILRQAEKEQQMNTWQLYSSYLLSLLEQIYIYIQIITYYSSDLLKCLILEILCVISVWIPELESQLCYLLADWT